MTSLSAHGSNTTDFRPMQNGVPVGTLISSGGLSGSVLNSQAAQEILPGTAFALGVWVIMKCGLLEQLEHSAMLFSREAAVIHEQQYCRSCVFLISLLSE